MFIPDLSAGFSPVRRSEVKLSDLDAVPPPFLIFSKFCVGILFLGRVLQFRGFPVFLWPSVVSLLVFSSGFCSLPALTRIMAVTQTDENVESQGNNRHPHNKGGKKRDSSQNPPKSPWTDLFKQSKETVDSSLKLKFCPPKNGTAVLEENEVWIVPKQWNFNLLGCFAGRFPGLTAIDALVDFWKVKCKVVPQPNGYVLFRFQSEQDRCSVLGKGPYFLYGKRLFLDSLPENFWLDLPDFAMVPTWVRLVDLPDKCWKPAALSKIASCLGNPICMDYNTKLAKKRDFARMLVEIDSSIPPIESIPILLPSGETIHQAVYFEQYPCFCVNCKSSKHWVENCPKLKGIPQADSAFPPLKIIDCKRNGNEWRWNKEDISPESVEPESVEKPADGPSDGDLLEPQVVVSPSEPAEPSAPADCVDIGANPTPTDEVCEAEQVNTMDGNVREDQTVSSLAESDSKSDEQVVSPSNLTVIPATAAALEGCEDEVEVIPRTPSMSSPSSRARIQWDEVPNFMPLFTTHLPSFGPFAFDKELIAYQLKANKAHEEFVAFQKEANRVCKEFVAMKKGISETLSPVKSAVGSPSKPFDFRAALLSPTTSQGDNVCNSSKAVPTPLRVISLSRGKGRKRPGAAVK
nr:hypothetical protein JCGZ_08271 [Ipomoea batatas]